MDSNNIDVREILTLLGIDYTDRGTQLFAKCPNPLHDDTNPSWNISTTWPHPHYCFACGYHGTIFKLIKQFGGPSMQQLLINDSQKDTPFHNSLILRSTFPTPKKQKPKYIRRAAPSITIRGDVHNPYDNNDCVSYMESRGVTPEFVNKFGLFYVDHARINEKIFSRCLCIPVYEKGRLVNIEGRSIYPERAKSKTIYPPKSRANTLFNIDNLDFTKPLYVTEGIMDLPKLYTLGYHNITSIFGALVTHRQGELLRAAPSLYVIPDNDASGRKMVRAIDDLYPWEFNVVLMPEHRKDPGECSYEELQQAIDSHTVTGAEFLLRANGIVSPSLEGALSKARWW